MCVLLFVNKILAVSGSSSSFLYKIFGQCAILGVKKIFPELLIANIFVINFFFVICIVQNGN